MKPTPTPTPTDDSPEALEALFTELSQARAAGTELPDDAPPEKPESEPVEAAPAPAAPIDAAAPAPAAAVPATPEVPAVPAAPAAVPVPAAPTPVPFDTSKLNQESRDYIEKIENERRAAIGRAAALQRELASGKRRQAAEQPAPVLAADDPTKKLAEEFPELSGALDASIAKAEQKFGEALRISNAKNKADALEGSFPNWVETMQSPEFNYWLTQQDEPMHKRFESDSVRDYAILLRSYELASAVVVVPPAPVPAAPSEVERIQKERAARQDRSVNVPSKPGAPNPTGEPDEADPEALFNWHSRKRDKSRERQETR